MGLLGTLVQNAPQGHKSIRRAGNIKRTAQLSSLSNVLPLKTCVTLAGLMINGTRGPQLASI